MGKISIKDLQSDRDAVTKALQAIKDPKVNPAGDAPGDNYTTAHENRNFYYDDRITYRDYVKAYNKLTKDQADYLSDNPALSVGDMQELDKMYNDARTSNSLGGDELHGRQLVDALKGNKGAIDPHSFDAEKAISLAGRLYQGEDLAHRRDDNGDIDLSTGPMDTRFTDYIDVGGTHELNGHLLTQAQGNNGKLLQNLDELTKNISARSSYLANNEGKDPATGKVIDAFKDGNGKVIHDAPFVQTADGKIYYPVYDGGQNYIQRALHGQQVSAETAANIAKNMTEDDKYSWVEKDTRGWLQTALDVLGSPAASFALLPLDPLFGLAAKGVSAVAKAGSAVAVSIGTKGFSSIAGAGGAVAQRLIRTGDVEATFAGSIDTSSSAATKVGAGNRISATPPPISRSLIGDESYLKDAAQVPRLPPGSSDKYFSFTSKLRKNDDGTLSPWDEEGPKAVDFRQGQLGNCWFASFLQNLAKQDNKYLEDMITPVKDKPGEFNVRLFNKDGKEVQVAVNCDLPANAKGECTLMGNGTSEIGGALIEKAAAKLRDYDGVGKSGYAGLAADTSQSASAMIFGKQTGSTYRADGRQDILTPSGIKLQTRDFWDYAESAVRKSVANKKVATVGFLSDDAKTGVRGGHLYSILDYEDGFITLLDPNLDPPENFIKNIKFDDLKKLKCEIYA